MMAKLTHTRKILDASLLSEVFDGTFSAWVGKIYIYSGQRLTLQHRDYFIIKISGKSLRYWKT